MITEGTEVGADSDERQTPYNDTMKRGMSVGDHVQNDTNWISASEAKAEKQEIQEKVTQRTHKALTQDVDGITLSHFVILGKYFLGEDFTMFCYPITICPPPPPRKKKNERQRLVGSFLCVINVKRLQMYTTLCCLGPCLKVHVRTCLDCPTPFRSQATTLRSLKDDAHQN